MKILICLSNVPDTTTKAKFVNDNKAFDTTGVQWIINPWDELALTRAIELKSNAANSIDNITVITVGKNDAEPTMRKALAIGADSAVRIDSEPKDAYFTAAQIAEYVKSNPFDIILSGIESSDYNGSAVGGMVAEFLNVPSVSAVSTLNIENGTVKITRDIDGGKEQLTSNLPMVAIVQKGIAKEPMIAAMRGIMMARQKPLQVVAPVAVDALTEVAKFEMPQPKPACKMIAPENVKELVDLLQNEAKVI